MRKLRTLPGKARSSAVAIAAIFALCSSVSGADASVNGPFKEVVNFEVSRAQARLVRVQALLEQGVVAKKDLDQAQAALADAQDEAILTGSLYGGTRVQDLSVEQAKEMVEAAERRVERQQGAVDENLRRVSDGILSRNEVQPALDELDMRKRALSLAKDRARLLDDLLAMAKVEEALAREHSGVAAGASNVMFSYAGTGHFDIGGLPAISQAFAKQFHEALPISALGQTILHKELGFDHRGRVDVSLNPDSKEGLWLRDFLETRRIPYIAFRAPVIGSATGPHIHLGTGSLRVKLGPAPDAPIRSAQTTVRTSSGT
jgi:multidrug resistance efflux pump